jgi:hypothetical protein
MHANMRSFRTHCFDGLQIRFGYLLGSIVGVTYFVTAQLAFSANFTCTGHSHILQDAIISIPFLLDDRGIPYHKSQILASEKSLDAIE